ncbi:hypothetical protein KPH14_007575 [Odynerus spinipes]|uniref:Uncharacterized protein n=1 Tax=Odynerus spinipes TaxID=1348599 RepID=A0AAD9RI57_9HYME|nr:hypothetical protein KPH14_007575 [Odynerus spinipes]
MRLILLLLICLADTAFSLYFRKTRFDRSIHDNVGNIEQDEPIKKRWTFTDDQTLYTAYKDRRENACYLEKLINDRTEHGDNSLQRERKKPRVLYVPNETLTKLEAWRIAGGRIVDFCRGLKIYHLQENQPIAGGTIDPFLNEVPIDENDIAPRRVADVVLVPLLSRAKREILLENREKLNKLQETVRKRRQATPYRGRFRGQTQSQYLNMGNDGQTEGKAEAEATQQSSRAVVAGNRGMGQAQSMSSSGSGCEDCPGYHPDYSIYVDQVPGKLQVQRPGKDGQYVSVPSTVGGTGTVRTGGYPGGVVPGTRPTGVAEQYPGGIIPGTTGPGGTVSGGQTYPGGVQQPSGGYPGGGYPGGGYPGGGYPGGGYPGGPVGPGRVIPGQYPGGVVPGTEGSSGTYPGGPDVFVPGGAATYPGGIVSGPGTTGGGGPYPGGTVPGTTTGTGGRYPNGVQPGPGTTGGGMSYPGGAVPGTTTGTGGRYPNGVSTGPDTTGGGGPYPGGAVPGTTTGTGGRYPNGVPTGSGTTGGGVSYPGGVIPGSVPPGGGGMYPTAVSTGSITAGSGVGYPGGIIPGTTTGGAGVYPGGTGPGTVTTGGGGSYPGGTGQGTVTTGGSGPYTGGTGSGSVPTGVDGRYSGVFIPGTVTSDGTYPGGVVPGTVSTGGGGGTYPGGVVSGEVTAGVGGTYPGSVGGGTVIQGGIPPETIRRPGGGYRTGVSYPTGIISGTGTGGVTYPNGVAPGVGTNGGVGAPYPITTGGTGIYPSGVPGTIITGGATYPSGVVTTDGKVIPGTGILPNIVTSAKTDIGASVSFPGTGQYPQKQIPSGTPTGAGYPGAPLSGSGTTQVTYPSGGGYPVSLYPNGGSQNGQYPPSGGVPLGQVTGIPAGGTGIQQYPGVQYQPGQYPGINQYYPGGTNGQVTVPGQGVVTGAQGVGVGQYPAQYPGGVGTGGVGTGDVLEPSQYYQKSKDISATSAEDDGADTQASSSVKQVDAGTEASASAQGKYRQGTAQSQVSGIYSGTASFSAQAGTSDINRSAQAQISGGKDGAVSNSEGVAGRGKSQAQVQLNSDTGSTSTGAQSSGWNHGTNSQVQASSKGGMADAQANGEGSTSSQAQIGFQPYLKDDDKVERHSSPFRGGGTASAQSGTHRGQSQSQLQGSFQYGITYSGAAQAGSGSGAAASRKPFNFNLTNPEFHKPKVPYKPNNTPSISPDEVTDVTPAPSDVDLNRIQKSRQGLVGSSSSRQMVVASEAKEKVESTMTKEQSGDNLHTDESVYNENDYVDDYEDDYDSPPANLDTSSSHKESESQHQSQMIQIGNANRYDVRVTQDSNAPREGDRLQPGQSLPGYTIPPGLRGRVMSVAGEDTIAQGDGKSQSQTVALVPKEPNATRDNKSLVSESRSAQNNYAHFTSNHASRSSDNYYNSQARSSSNSFLTRDLEKAVRPSYYTVTNSVTGKIGDNRNSQKKYEHRYYTKSSTCGYFTFSCNIVYGSNGRTKICKPKVPTYPDGTPMKC